MPKRTKKTLNDCEEHLFVLKAKQSFCRFGQTASISFCQIASDKNKNKNKQCRNCQALDCPIFNKDRNFATPTFILSSQKQYYEQKGIKMRDEHQKKMVEYTDEKDSLNVPKPRTRNNFCSVCRQVYEDYLEHIESEKHKKKINTSTFNKYILDAVEKFNPNLKNNDQFNYPTLSTGDQDDVEVLQTIPMKKVKTDFEMYPRYPNEHDLRQGKVVPPPHLNLGNSAYFPGFGTAINYMPNQMHPFPIEPPINYQMPFGYPMNMGLNPYYHQNPYGMMNPWMDCYSMQQLNLAQYQKMEQNCFLEANIHMRMPRPQFLQPNFFFQNEEPNQVIDSLQEVIVIDDDESEKREKPEINV